MYIVTISVHTLLNIGAMLLLTNYSWSDDLTVWLVVVVVAGVVT